MGFAARHGSAANPIGFCKALRFKKSVTGKISLVLQPYY